MIGWDNLPQFSKDMYQERYFADDENYDGWVERISNAYSDDKEHSLRIQSYLRRKWFHPSTPISSNAGMPERGLPISCYTNQVDDSKTGIFKTWEENNWLGSYGGGIGTTWKYVREVGHRIGTQGYSSGKIPFIKVSDSTTLAVSQGGLRRASQAVYVDVDDPEIIEFIDIRRPTGDTNRRSPNIHHGINISDKFMKAMIANSDWDLISPKDGTVISTVNAFDLWKKILISRMETGEPYIMFGDNVNARLPYEYAMHKRSVVVSNLCTEIFLHTDADTSGVCCLVSVNAEKFDEWEEDILFLEDVHRFTDNVLQSFIDLTDNLQGFERVRKGAMEERSIGIGVMGYHGLLQSRNLEYDGLASKYLTRKLFSHIKSNLNASNIKLGIEKGCAPISDLNRNVHVMAVAPTASISTLNGLATPGIDPRVANVYTAKTNIGSYTIRNPYLAEALAKEGMDTDEVWKQILEDKGSVQDIDVSQKIKDVFMTAYEIDNRHIVDNVAIMTEYVCQGTSTNLFLPADSHVNYVHQIHLDAWKKGLKSLYYVRSTALNKATIHDVDRECLSCQ